MNERAMMVKLEQLESLTTFIHDYYFNRDRIDFDLCTNILSIPFVHEKWEDRVLVSKFLLRKEYRVPDLEYILRIFHVKSYQIKEPWKDGPGSSDMFLSINYDEKKRQLLILTEFAKGIEIEVEDFEMYLVETDRVLVTKTHRLIFEPAINEDFSDTAARRKDIEKRMRNKGNQR